MRFWKIPDDLKMFLSHLPPPLKGKIRASLDILLRNPNEGKPLRAELTGLWSLRVGRFRIIYRPSSQVLEIVAIGPRNMIYQTLARRLVGTRQ